MSTSQNNNNNNTNGSSDDDDDGDGSSVGSGEFSEDSDMEELETTDFPTYFVERDGRLFHSHQTSPYPLPVDTPEQERMNVQHRILFELLGTHYPPNCPVPAVLAQDPVRRRYVLDVCTGTGKWVMDMARDFPHVAFRGYDIVPIVTRYPLPNVQFSIHDVNTIAPWGPGTFDLVHARSISMATVNFPALIAESARLLRPGGLFIAGEWSRMLFTVPAPGTPATATPVTQQTAPFLTAFFGALHAALTTPPNPLPASPPLVAQLIAGQPNNFHPASITVATHFVPLGPWQPQANLQRIGRAFRNVFRAYMNSVRPLLANKSGLAPPVLAQVYTGARLELRNVQGIVALYNTVYARRI
ncbi:S-adenosyl-L-methionine-dependent methyltransferase [Mycena amicta]|nr:S-adenosyl-L-methionine-dependent methyltransferase [Mycena amicta]